MWREVALAVLLTTAAGGVVAAGHADAQLPADVAVTGATCADGGVMALDLRVSYHGATPTTVTAHVWSARQHVQYAWQPTRTTLRPGVQRLSIRAPDPRAQITAPPVQIALAAGQQRVIVNTAEVGRCDG